ncbi:MAG: hypothetical protein HDR02_15275, partial [Lachnospiraceae bacterium]|nr:hypothetical protein [Lachnospiraceae bacterium]
FQQPEVAEEEELEPQQPEMAEELEFQQPEVAEEEEPEFQQPEVAEEEEPEPQQPALDIFEQVVSEPDGESESDMAWETEFDMFKDPESEMSEQVESDISEQAEFDVPEQPEFDMDEQPVLDMAQPEDSEQGDDDLSSLLESLGAEGQEISDLLDKAEQDEPVDMVDSLMQELNEELSPDARYAEEDYSDEMAELLERPSKKKKKKERVKKEKVKKEKKPRGKKKKEVQEPVENPSEESSESIEEGTIESAEDSIIITTQQEAEEIISAEAAAGEKKQGFWSKLLNALIQEDEDEEEPADLISDENGAILEELDKEKKQAKGKKKKGKDKKGKDKKAAESEDDDELEEDSKGKGKKKKEKKPKKEKPPVPVEDLLPGKKLPLKKVMSIMLVMLVLGLAYVLVSHLYIDYVNKKGAEKAYYAGDYMECYSLLFGQDRNENQDLMYHRSELALQMERMKGNYRRMVMEGKELEALDYLVQCVCHKEASYLQAQEWNCMDIVEETYAGMISLMTANYGLSEERAAEIVALKSDVDYTLALIEVLEKRGSDSTAGDESEQQESISYEDLLPEEEENSDTAFVDTME